MKSSGLLLALALLVGVSSGCTSAEGDGHKSDPTPPGQSNADVKSQQDFMNYANQQGKNAGSKSPQIKQ